MVLFISYGIRLRGVRLMNLIGENRLKWKAIVRDLSIAVAFLFTSDIVLLILRLLLGANANRVIDNLVPHGRTEMILYLLLALTAGIAEEVIFRGYLQLQFIAWTGSATAAVLLQGVAFGLAHGYQGAKSMLILGVYGIFFGCLAQWRQSLRPGMMTHVLQDSLFGILNRNIH